MLEDYDRAEALVLWLLELFPCVYATVFRIKYNEQTGRIEWGVIDSTRDNDDLFNLIFYGVKRNFFEKVVAPRLCEKVAGIAVSYVWAGDERVVVHFEPHVRRVHNLLLGERLRALDTLEMDCWPQRTIVPGGHDPPPPQDRS